MASLTARQRAVLQFGDSSGYIGKGFISADEAERAWMAHRGELLKACAGSVARPDAYFRYELGQQTPGWILDVRALYEHGRLPAPSMESPSMTESQPDQLHIEFETAESVRALGLPPEMLEGLLREFGTVEAYMLFRRRAGLARKYGRIGAAIRQVLREKFNPLQKESIQ